MPPSAGIGLIFLVLAFVFLAAALRHRAAGVRSPAQRTWLRIALIFAIVGIGLQLVHRFAR